MPSLAPLKAPKRPDFDSLVGLALAFWDRGRVYQSALLLHQANKLEGRRDVQFQEKLARAMLRVFHMTCSASSLRAGTEAYECALNAKEDHPALDQSWRWAIRHELSEAHIFSGQLETAREAMQQLVSDLGQALAASPAPASTTRC